MENDDSGIKKPILSFDHNGMSSQDVKDIIKDFFTNDDYYSDYMNEDMIADAVKALSAGRTYYDGSSDFYVTMVEYVELV